MIDLNRSKLIIKKQRIGSPKIALMPADPTVPGSSTGYNFFQIFWDDEIVTDEKERLQFMSTINKQINIPRLQVHR